tara:strand:+ start:58 stop:2292 length:2235 start_codon:yes stop_codon:yes gene_type:complete
MLDQITFFLNQFGGKYSVFFLILFICSSFLICSIIRKNKIRLFFSLFFSLFIILQTTSLFFTQSFIGYQFYVHFNFVSADGIIGLYLKFIIYIFFFFIFLNIFFLYSNVFLRKKIIQKTNFAYIKIAVFSLSIFILATLLVKSNFIEDSKSLSSIFYSNINSSSFADILKKNGINNYISPNEIISSKGKNVIVISLESLEKAFLFNDRLKELTPNLINLKDSWNYYNLSQNHGSSWTSGSLYTYLTGFPAYFGVEGNTIFQKTFHSEISSISHILKKANYELTYLNGNTNSSGIKNMLHTLKFDKIIDNSTAKGVFNQSEYGIRDYDLFELAKIEVLNKIEKKTPFGIFISTTDTHFPDGIYDKRMENHLESKNSNLEFMVASVDFMVGKFIKFLKNENVLENTIIFIFPDHLKMGDPNIFNEKKERSLYLISNANSDKLKITDLNTNYQIDLPKIILNGMGVKHNVKFFSEYINENKNEFIKRNIPLITEINTNGIFSSSIKPFTLNKASTNYEVYKKDKLRYIAHSGGKIDNLTYTNCKEALDLNYQKGFRLFELDIISTRDGKYVAAHDWKHWSKITKFKGSLPPTLNEFLETKIYNTYTPLDINEINKWFANHKDAVLVTDKINEPIDFSEKFIDKKRLMMELFDLNALKDAIKVNIKPIASQSVIEKVNFKKIKKIGVKHIAISRNFIKNNKDILKKFKVNNMKVFAYHLNYNEGFDEDYVTKYEMDFIFGIYADDWDF